MSRGRFITFEGIEGVGKSTNIATLAQHIEQAGHAVLRTREPGGTPNAERIREIVSSHSEEPMPDIAELMLIFAARSLHVENVIRPAVEQGVWVICDRFTDSSRAYQGSGRGIDMAIIDELASLVHEDLWPDLTILLDAPVDVGMARASRRSDPDRFESERVEFFDRVRAGYLAIAQAEPQRVTVVDANRSLDTVAAEIDRIALALLDN